MVEVSTIIVNYRSLEKTLTCLKSLKSSDLEGIELEIIVVDNNSEDGSAEKLKNISDINFIQSKKNDGMGVGNNLGIKVAKAKDYILILNPDTELYTDTIKSMVDFMEKNREVGLIGPRLVYPDGTPQQSYFRWPNILMPVFRRTFLGRFAKDYLDYYLMKNFDTTIEGEVNWIMGSVMLIRKNVLDKIGLFDERFFMYFEDTDLCRRIKKAGNKVVYYPLVEAVHHHTRASAKESWYVALFKNKLARVHIYSALKYFKKWGS